MSIEHSFRAKLHTMKDHALQRMVNAADIPYLAGSYPMVEYGAHLVEHGAEYDRDQQQHYRQMMIHYLARKYIMGTFVALFKRFPADVNRYIGQFFDYNPHYYSQRCKNTIIDCRFLHRIYIDIERISFGNAKLIDTVKDALNTRLVTGRQHAAEELYTYENYLARLNEEANVSPVELYWMNKDDGQIRMWKSSSSIYYRSFHNELFKRMIVKVEKKSTPVHEWIGIYLPLSKQIITKPYLPNYISPHTYTEKCFYTDDWWKFL